MLSGDLKPLGQNFSLEFVIVEPTMFCNILGKQGESTVTFSFSCITFFSLITLHTLSVKHSTIASKIAIVPNRLIEPSNSNKSSTNMLWKSVDATNWKMEDSKLDDLEYSSSSKNPSSCSVILWNI